MVHVQASLIDRSGDDVLSEDKPYPAIIVLREFGIYPKELHFLP